MRKSILGLSAVAFAMLATPAMAQEEAADPLGLKVTGSAGLVSDYRFRGFSQTSEDPAVQGSINLNHESGFYVGTWASSISFNGNVEIDLYAGYTRELTPGLTLDVGLLYYLYPDKGNPANTDFFEPYVNLIGTVGPATIKAGINYAWDQSALLDANGDKSSAIYFHVEPSIAIPNTPLGLNAHFGYSESDAFPGGFGDGKVLDYSVGATLAWQNLTFGVSYVDTDEAKVRPAGNGAEAIGADAAVVFSLTAAF